MRSSQGEGLLQLHLELVDADKKIFMPQNRQPSGKERIEWRYPTTWPFWYPCSTVDEEIYFKHFEYVGQTLAGIWSKLVINDHPAIAEFVKVEPSDINITELEEWKTSHVCKLQYLLQIIKSLTYLVALQSNRHTWR